MASRIVGNMWPMQAAAPGFPYQTQRGSCQRNPGTCPTHVSNKLLSRSAMNIRQTIWSYQSTVGVLNDKSGEEKKTIEKIIAAKTYRVKVDESSRPCPLCPSSCREAACSGYGSHILACRACGAFLACYALLGHTEAGKLRRRAAA